MTELPNQPWPETPPHRAAAEAVARLRSAGFAAFAVGGAVRDLLLGRAAHDVDLVTAARPEELRNIFPQSRLVGANFGVSLVRVGETELEVATAREERNYLDGRHPELVRYTTDPEIDVQRRDFTINALLADPLDGRIIDCVGGIEDLRRGVIRTVGDPRVRFAEDYLRMLRAVRFAARFRFRLDPETADAIREFAPRTAELAAERIRAELTGMLTGPDPARAVRLLHKLGILAAVLPEIAALDGVEQPPEFHPEGDVFAHTMLMLSHLRAADPVLAWSVLLHDVGKPAARSVDPDGRVRFFNHEAIGAEMAREIAARLRFPLADVETIAGAVRRHMHFAQVAEMKRSTLRKLLGSATFPLELELNRLDCISCHGKLDAFVRLLDEVVRRDGEVTLPAPLVRGADLIAAGFPPSPAFGRVLAETFEYQLEHGFADAASARQFAADRLTRPAPEGTP